MNSRSSSSHPPRSAPIRDAAQGESPDLRAKGQRDQHIEVVVRLSRRGRAADRALTNALHHPARLHGCLLRLQRRRIVGHRTGLERSVPVELPRRPHRDPASLARLLDASPVARRGSRDAAGRRVLPRIATALHPSRCTPARCDGMGRLANSWPMPARPPWRGCSRRFRGSMRPTQRQPTGSSCMRSSGPAFSSSPAERLHARGHGCGLGSEHCSGSLI